MIKRWLGANAHERVCADFYTAQAIMIVNVKDRFVGHGLLARKLVMSGLGLARLPPVGKHAIWL